MKVADIVLGENFSREDVGDCKSLAASISNIGLLSPLVVDINNTLVAGFRRFHVIKDLLGWTDVQVVVLPSNVNPGLANLQENLERSELTFYEEAQAVRRLFPDSNEKQVADALEQSRSWARVRIKMWELPAEIIALIKSGKLSPTKVALLVVAKNPNELCDKIIESSNNDARLEAGHAGRPTRKQIQATMTECIQRGLTDVVQAFRFALGDIDEEGFWESVDR